MFRSALSRQSRISSKLRRQCFHSTPRYHSDAAVSDAVQILASKCYVFHDFFQHVHGIAALPWLVSIPLATMLMRSLITPARIYFALCRQEQRLAMPRLRFAAKIVERQSEARLAAGAGSVEQNNEWKKKQWEKRREEIEKIYPLAQPSLLASTKSNFDITNLGAMGLVLINTSTLLALSVAHPTLFALNAIDHIREPLSFLFSLLAIFNTSSVSARPLGDNMPNSWNPFIWTESETQALVVLVLPCSAAFALSFCPSPVVLFALSNSAYTLLERVSINHFFKAPPEVDLEIRTALQSTREQKARIKP